MGGGLFFTLQVEDALGVLPAVTECEGENHQVDREEAGLPNQVASPKKTMLPVNAMGSMGFEVGTRGRSIASPPGQSLMAWEQGSYEVKLLRCLTMFLRSHPKVKLPDLLLLSRKAAACVCLIGTVPSNWPLSSDVRLYRCRSFVLLCRSLTSQSHWEKKKLRVWFRLGQPL